MFNKIYFSLQFNSSRSNINIDSGEIVINPTNSSIFNTALENGFYDFPLHQTPDTKEQIAGLKYTFDNSNTDISLDDVYLNKVVLDKLLTQRVSPPIKGKFATEGSSEAINDFMDFGIKGTTPNFYIKNIRYILDNNEHREIINAVNDSVVDITQESINFDAFLLKPIVGDTDNDPANGIFALINNNINGGERSDGLMRTLFNKRNYLDTVGASQSDTTENELLLTKMYREYVIYCMELLYTKLAYSLQGDTETHAARQAKAERLFSSGQSGFENVRSFLNNLSSISNFTSTIELRQNDDDTIRKSTTINLSYYYQLVIVLLKLRTQIIKDRFLNKLNCKYLSYMFYSFHSIKTILGDYIENIQFDTYEKNIL